METNYIDVYLQSDDSSELIYLHSFEHTDLNIANYVANLPIFGAYILKDPSTGETILTTIGNFLNRVPNQTWLQTTLHPLLVPRQLNSKLREPVELVEKK